MANNASSDPVPLIMTRPLAASEAFVAALPESVGAGFYPLYSPLLQIVPTGADASISPTDAAIFTSSNGVDAAPDGAGRRAYCVGAATAKAATARGWAAQQCGMDAQSLVDTLVSKRPAGRLVHLSGRHSRGDITGQLARAGLHADRIAIYDQHLCDLTAEATQTIDREKLVVVPLFSPRTAVQFARVVPDTKSVFVVALSPSVAEIFDPQDLAGLTVAAQPDAKAMGIALAQLV